MSLFASEGLRWCEIRRAQRAIYEAFSADRDCQVHELRARLMAGMGGVPPDPRSEAFDNLIRPQTRRSGTRSPPKFVKRIEDVPEVALPPEETMRVALSLADRSLIEQVTGLWPSPKTTDSWVQRNWRPIISKNVASYSVGRGFFLFDFETKEDKDLIFRNGPYFMGPQGLYLNGWTPDCNPKADIPKSMPVWVRLPTFPCIAGIPNPSMQSGMFLENILIWLAQRITTPALASAWRWTLKQDSQKLLN